MSAIINPGGIDVSIGGNTAGVLTLISTGTLLLAGGNNITLSQSQNSVTISAVTAGGGSFSAGISTGGNTSGTSGTVSGQFVLAGGNNITLSQSVNGASASLTISAFNQTVESQSAGMSNLGNTSGTTGIASGAQVQLLLAGGNNVTLSQSLNGASATVTISAFNQTVESNTLGMSNLGNTSGTTGVVSGAQVRYLLAGGNNVTLSQSLNGVSGTLTISAFNQTVESQTFGMSNLGNTSGTTGVVSGGQIRFVLAGGNNITLSQSLDAGNVSGTITISAANETQTVPPIGTAVKVVQTSGSTGTITRFAPEDHAHQGLAGIDVQGVASTFFGTYQLSAGALISIATGGNTSRGSAQIINLLSTATSVSSVSSANAVGENASRFALEAHIHAGVGPAGVSNIGNTMGNTAVLQGQLVLAGGNNVTLSQSTNASNAMTVTISGGLTGPTLSYWDNLYQPIARLGMSSIERSLYIAPFNLNGGLFPGNMTVSTLHLHLSFFHTNTSATTQGQSSTFSIGFYTLNGNTLSLWNSGSTTWGFAAASDMSSNYHGPRVLSFNSSLFASSLSFSQTQYWMGVWLRTSGTSVSFAGNNGFWLQGVSIVSAAQQSGTIGTSIATATSMGYRPFGPGIYSVSFTSGMPSALNASDISYTQTFVPGVQFNNITAAF